MDAALHVHVYLRLVSRSLRETNLRLSSLGSKVRVAENGFCVSAMSKLCMWLNSPAVFRCFSTQLAVSDGWSFWWRAQVPQVWEDGVHG